MFEERFFALAPAAFGDLLDPQRIGVVYLGGVLLHAPVPGVPVSESPVISNQLQLLYAPGFLGGYWGCSHLWDDWDEEDPEALHITLDLAPAQAAERAVEWVTDQLRRPVARQEWTSLLRRTQQRWVLEDTGRELGRRGLGLLRRRAPDRTVRVRPGRR